MPYKIRTKIFIAFVSVLAPVVFLFVFNHFQLKALQRFANEVEERANEIKYVYSLQLDLARFIMPANDYLITGDPKEKDEFYRIAADIEKGFNQYSGLKVCGACHTPKRNIFERFYGLEIKENWPDEMRFLKEVRDGFETIKGKGEEILRTQSPVGSQKGAALMKEMDASAHKLVSNNISRHIKSDEEELKEAIEADKRVRAKYFIVRTIGYLSVIIIAVFFAIYYSRLFTRPIKELRNGAYKIAKGDFKTRLDIKTGDEIEQLSDAMNEMSAQLDSLYSNMQAMVEERTLELKESEERFRSVSESAPDAIICIKEHGIIYFWNKKAEEIFGYKASEVVNRHIHDVICPERYKEKSGEGFKGFSKTGAGPIVGKTIEIEGLKKDGTEFPVELSISAMNIKGEWHATGIIRDITARKETEKRLTEQMDFLARFHKAAVQREFRIKELKDENKILKARIEELEKR